MDPVELERIVDRELNALPQPKAPSSLMPRVMAAVRLSSESPWYARAWFTWPKAWQAISVAALVVLVVGLARLLPMADAAAEIVRSSAGLRMPDSIVAATGWVRPFWDAAHIMWRVMVEPIIGYIAMFVLTMSAACVLFGTALNRVALGGPSEI